MSNLEELQERRKNVLDAIDAVLITGQSYQIGSRKKSNADLNQLKALLAQLDTEIAAAQSDGSLLPGVRQAYFDGR